MHAKNIRIYITKMKFQKIIQLFIPPIYYKVKQRLFSPKEQEVHPLVMLEHKRGRMVVIGNGPSLNKSIELYEHQIKESDIIMVNFAAMTDLFFTLRPSVYLLVDPGWFNPAPSQVESCNRCVDTIVLRTEWPMAIVMPISAKQGYSVEKFKKNPNIKVLFYEDGWDAHQGMSQYEKWDKNLICPPGQTVLNTAVWLSIYWGYKETFLVGADTSWHAELKMDQETNVLYTIDTHFYDNKKVYQESYDEKQNRRPIGTKLHEELYAEATALREYWNLRGYADWKGVKVYNASEYSWIDAFERKKLS